MAPSDATYSTPSERWSSSIRRFFSLRPLDGWRLIRAIWPVAVVVFGLQILSGLANISTTLWTANWTGLPAVALLTVLISALVRLLEPLMWLL